MQEYQEGFFSMSEKPRESLAFLILRGHMDEGGEIGFASDPFAKGPVPLDRQDLARQIQLCSEVLSEWTNTATDTELAGIQKIVAQMRRGINNLTERH